MIQAISAVYPDRSHRALAAVRLGNFTVTLSRLVPIAVMKKILRRVTITLLFLTPAVALASAAEPASSCCSCCPDCGNCPDCPCPCC
jgi:hypothetical protein